MQGAAHIMTTLDIAINLLLSQGYEVKHLRNSFKKFNGRYPDLIGDSFNAVVQLVLSLSLLFKFYY